MNEFIVNPRELHRSVRRVPIVPATVTSCLRYGFLAYVKAGEHERVSQ